MAPEGTGDGLYLRRYPVAASGFLVPQPEQLVYVSLSNHEERTIGFQWGPAILSPDGRSLAYQLSQG